MSSYPSVAATFPARAGGQTIFAQHMQLLQDEVSSVEAGFLNGFAHTLWGAQALTLSGALTPPQLTANVNDYAPTGLATAATLRLSSDAARTITGVLAQAAGRVICLMNCNGNFSITLANQSASSAATNRIICPGVVDYVMAKASTVWLWYDTVNSFWRVILTAAGIPTAPPPVTNIGAKVYTTTTQAITAGGWTTLTFNAEEFDYGNCWVVGAPTRLTVPAGQGGVYLVYSKQEYALAANMQTRFLKNGAVISTQLNINSTEGSSQDRALLLLNAGDYVETQVIAPAVSAASGGSARSDANEFGMFKQNPT